MKYRKLTSMPCAQAIIETTNHGDECLISYQTRVAYIFHTTDAIWIACTGTYSATTRKHISAFARENGMSYQDFKLIAGTNLLYNPFTGEIKEASEIWRE